MQAAVGQSQTDTPRRRWCLQWTHMGVAGEGCVRGLQCLCTGMCKGGCSGCEKAFMQVCSSM
jgi:hypothetical protein